MSEELLSILRSCRRKLLASRSAESAAITVTASAVFAAVVELAWASAHWRTWAGLLLCAGAAVGAPALACLALRQKGRRVLSPAWPAVASGVALAALGAWAIEAGWFLYLPKAAVAGVGVVLGAVLGAGGALARGVTLRQAAAWLDAKGGLRERLSTAAEWLTSETPAPDSARAVYAQALKAVQDRRPQEAPLWSRTPAVLAALGLALAACLAAAMLPDFGSGAAAGDIHQFSQSVAAMTPAQRAELADAFRRAAERAANDPAVAEQLRQAALTVEVKDAAELERLLKKLQEAGYVPLGPVPAPLLAAAGLTPKATPTTGESQGVTKTPEPIPSTRTANVSDSNAASGGYVRVYDPLYRPTAVAPAADGNSATVSSRPMAPFSEAWARARARASAAAAGGTVPPAYRRLVRDFFAADE